MLKVITNAEAAESLEAADVVELDKQDLLNYVSDYCEEKLNQELSKGVEQ